jgi:peptide/nickel transport system substrate-binding protein
MQAVYYGWFNGPEPDDTFFWNSSQIVSKTVGAGGNFDGYSNPEVDKLTTEGVQVLDTGKRAAIYKQLQAVLAKDVPDIFIEWGRVLTAATSKLHGYDPMPFEQSLTWNAKDWSMS